MSRMSWTWAMLAFTSPRGSNGLWSSLRSTFSYNIIYTYNTFHCIQYFGYLWSLSECYTIIVQLPHIQTSHCMRASSTSRDDALLVPSARVTTLQCLTPSFRSTTLNVSTLHTKGDDKYFMYIHRKLSIFDNANLGNCSQYLAEYQSTW